MVRKISSSILLKGIIMFAVGCGPGAAPPLPEQNEENERRVKEDLDQVQKQEGAEQGDN